MMNMLSSLLPFYLSITASHFRASGVCSRMLDLCDIALFRTFGFSENVRNIFYDRVGCKPLSSAVFPLAARYPSTIFLFSMMTEHIADSLTMQSEEKRTLPPPVIVLNTPLGIEAIPIESIVSCSADGKYAFLHRIGESKPDLVYHSLAELSTLLGKHTHFVRCHKSLVLNVRHCTGWRHHRKKDALACVIVGEKCAEYKVSRTYKAAFVRAWREWVQKV